MFVNWVKFLLVRGTYRLTPDFSKCWISHKFLGASGFHDTLFTYGMEISVGTDCRVSTRTSDLEIGPVGHIQCYCILRHAHVTFVFQRACLPCSDMIW